ncbi:DUF3043 domain-containing protein [Actinocorallia sp. A-T 12471]|uniref:DUF3043 domain-containing protein n=1 Tax=Actinocorallia sp. A-T 12471 TaxID=3089813 RepID=UPI0029CF4D9A|nr:DUF3043 domain-containing protein [Actinocorallia sp. A-T 12471]MDX6743217.1 DUF3043 domain-containing protein [Actinocorallia sp. A-T 12471]
MFRRGGTTPQTPETVDDRPLKEGGKNRPTPKRAEAEGNRRHQRVSAPKDRKEAYKAVRERQARDREKAREGMARGDAKYLPKRDQGPVRQLARDYVDARRTVGSYLMLIMFVVVIASFVPSTFTQLVFVLVPPVLLAVVLTESLLIAQGVKRLAKERFPSESVKGVGLYAASRSLQIRRLRLPNPRRKPGEKNLV